LRNLFEEFIGHAIARVKRDSAAFFFSAR
jgi:hypothetical protein